MCVTLIGKESRHFSFLHESSWTKMLSLVEKMADDLYRLFSKENCYVCVNSSFSCKSKRKDYFLFKKLKKKVCWSETEWETPPRDVFPRPSSSPFQVPNATEVWGVSFLLVFFPSTMRDDDEDTRVPYRPQSSFDASAKRNNSSSLSVSVVSKNRNIETSSGVPKTTFCD